MIGLDIGSKYIKMCQVDKRSDGTYQLKSALMAVNPAVSGSEIDDDTITDKIKQIMKKGSFSTNLTASSLGTNEVLTKDLTFPKLNKNELNNAVSFEIEQSMSSTALYEMYKDFAVLNPDDDKLDILFAAVPKKTIDRYIQASKNAELDLIIIDVDNLALANCYMTFEPNRNVPIVLLNIGHSYTNISVIYEDKLRFVRNVNVGGKNITLEIADSFGVSFEIAEEIKKRHELWEEIGLNMKNILRKSLPILLDEVYKSINYCKSRKKIISDEEIVITGGTSLLTGIDDFFKEILGIQTTKWNPLEGITIKGEHNKELGQLLPLALGLAIRK